MTRILSPERTDEFLRVLGDPATALRELQQTRDSAHILSSDRPRLIEQFPQRWVAVHKGEVIADAASLDELLMAVETNHPASRHNIIVRFIDRQPQMWFF